ncbi:hypothetical protein [Shouchella lehensis]|uniref:3D domain-containing protein n=1 Tax=Shouchella lehensis TaxID=300825 RepID=A0A4Y7WMM6_9BACI|nr:hypothetical protein [Shouchella lehensis]MBG9783094.1 hypothetical protein [Shouchella lehensis]TES49544.1 hypothetical protein E2L03_08740 [Shouchella lehensis]
MKKLITSVALSPIIIGLCFIVSNDEASAARYSNQDVTAYVASSGSKTYHGSTPRQYSTAAVHPNTCGVPRSGTIFPYGTHIYTTTNLTMVSGVTKRSFYVEDMGDVNCNRGLTRQWFDIYFGVDNNTNKSNATKFGKKRVNYDTTAPPPQLLKKEETE